MSNNGLISINELQVNQKAYQASHCIVFDGIDLWTFTDKLSLTKGGTALVEITYDGHEYCVLENTIIWEDVRDYRGQKLASATHEYMTGFNQFVTAPVFAKLKRV